MTDVRKALSHSFLGANTVTIVQFLSTLIIARLLTPEELGVYSVAAVFVGIAAIVRDFGINNYIIQVRELTDGILRSAFGLILLSATLLGMLLLASAEHIAAFYREPSLALLFYVLAVNFFVTPFGTIRLTIARRSMRFREFWMIRVVSALVSVIISICLIVLDFGPVSLAWGAVAGSLTMFFMSLRLRDVAVPVLPSLRNAREIVSFGSLSAAANMLGYANISSSDIVIGRTINLEAVGYFNRASSLTRFIESALESILEPLILPWFSQLRRSDTDPKNSYIRVTEYTTAVTWPIFAIVAIYCDEIIRILFGDQWGPSAVLVPFFCLAAAIKITHRACYPLFFAAGKPSINLILHAISLLVSIVVILMLSDYGLTAIAMAWPVISIVSAFTAQVMLARHTGITVADTFVAIKKNLLISAGALLIAYLFRSTINSPAGYLVDAFVGGSLTALCVIGMFFMMRHPLAIELSAAWRGFRGR